MALLLELYLAGLAATLVTAVLAERGWPRHQRGSLGRQLALALVWPLYLAFLGAVVIASAEER